MLHCVFKDVNENVLKIQDVWYPIDNDGLIVIEKGRVTNEKITRVWKDGAFKDFTDTSTISNDDMYFVNQPIVHLSNQIQRVLSYLMLRIPKQ